MLDITVIWFPAVKLIVTMLLMYGLYYTVSKKYYKTAAVYGTVLIMFWILAPIKYDGTNSVQHSIKQQQQRTQQYKSVSSDATIVHTKKLTFDERMALEASRSDKANKKVTDEIVR